VDGIALVIASGKVRPEIAAKAKDLLMKAKGHILGVVLNRIEIEKEHAHYYYYYSADDKQKQGA
ncbi:MAG TPA: capsular biosynthesis protein, partial [Bacillota bacterium]|nr:capsular biosynthesis protein [Bacillota bacterium]